MWLWGAQSCFNVVGANNLAFKGQGAHLTKLLIANPIAGFLTVANSKNISLDSFSIDYKKLPFTQGKIVRVSPNDISFDMVVDDGYPTFSDINLFSPGNMANSYGMLFDPKVPHLKRDPNYVIKEYFSNIKAIKNSDNSWNVQLDKLNDWWTIGSFSVGDRFVYSIRETRI